MMQLLYHPNRDITTESKADSILRYICRKFQHAHDILDLGVCRGYFVNACVEAGLNAYGIDLRDMYEWDRKRFIRADARELPFHDGVFDIVTESYMIADIVCLQELPIDESKKTVKEVQRVLKPEGIFITMPISMVSEFFEGQGFTLLEEYEPVARVYSKCS
ncbi:MAG: class I SAM-dependent methyltransferase [Candidatus Aenigmarchaeota archaeon]|nr:class I SAM-dependent methyltransferase [Candidatus Aenigmarchaeota archaeon]